MAGVFVGREDDYSGQNRKEADRARPSVEFRTCPLSSPCLARVLRLCSGCRALTAGVFVWREDDNGLDRIERTTPIRPLNPIMSVVISPQDDNGLDRIERTTPIRLLNPIASVVISPFGARPSTTLSILSGRSQPPNPKIFDYSPT